ncbi:hypothetical protein QTP88_026035 [Uroleucon formosanum]
MSSILKFFKSETRNINSVSIYVDSDKSSVDSQPIKIRKPEMSQSDANRNFLCIVGCLMWTSSFRLLANEILNVSILGCAHLCGWCILLQKIEVTAVTVSRLDQILLEKGSSEYKFIDLEKAFDKVPCKGIFYTLEGIGTDYKDRRIIYNLYKDQSAIIKVTDKTETAIIRKGVKQGCPLSPTLFNIYAEQPIKEIRETLLRNKIGIKVSGEIISFLRFADDMALLANNEHNLEKTLE